MQSLCLKPWFLELHYKVLLLDIGSHTYLRNPRVQVTWVGSTVRFTLKSHQWPSLSWMVPTDPWNVQKPEQRDAGEHRCWNQLCSNPNYNSLFDPGRLSNHSGLWLLLSLFHCSLVGRNRWSNTYEGLRTSPDIFVNKLLAFFSNYERIAIECWHHKQVFHKLVLTLETPGRKLATTGTAHGRSDLVLTLLFKKYVKIRSQTGPGKAVWHCGEPTRWVSAGPGLSLTYQAQKVHPYLHL